jgi:hypothetical protein
MKWRLDERQPVGDSKARSSEEAVLANGVA